MKTRLFFSVAVVICLAALSSCTTKKEGTVEGSVNPPGPGMQVTVNRDGKPVRSTDIDPLSGKFRIALPPGKYDVSVSSPGMPFPSIFSGVTVISEATATLPAIETRLSLGAAKLTGKVLPRGGTTVSLLAEGKERAAISPDPEGKYEFSNVPPGAYTLRVSAPGYAVSNEEVTLSSDQSPSRNMRLLYLSEIDGVDWSQGVVRARGRGKFPPDSPSPTIRREMAKRAALSDAERNLVRTVELIKIDANHDIKSSMTNSAFSLRIKGYLQGFKVIGERDIDGGVEMELELPLTGKNGLTGILAE
jgi:hypothetical protein